MRVRERALPRTEDKGRETDARDELCPSRPCYNAHNCARSDSNYLSHPDMRCAIRENHGCPMPLPKPEHIYKSERARVCQRCGERKRPPADVLIGSSRATGQATGSGEEAR